MLAHFITVQAWTVHTTTNPAVFWGTYSQSLRDEIPPEIWKRLCRCFPPVLQVLSTQGRYSEIWSGLAKAKAFSSPVLSPLGLFSPSSPLESSPHFSALIFTHLFSAVCRSP